MPGVVINLTDDEATMARKRAKDKRQSLKAYCAAAVIAQIRDDRRGPVRRMIEEIHKAVVSNVNTSAESQLAIDGLTQLGLRPGQARSRVATFALAHPLAKADEIIQEVLRAHPQPRRSA